MAEVFFFLAAIGTMGGAIGVVAARNAFYATLALVTHLIFLAALFLLLRAEFVAAAQVVVYAGAVMVLYVFVVAYVGGETRPLFSAASPLRFAAVLFAGALVIELLIATLGSGLQAIDSEGAPYDPAFGSAGQIGELFLTKFLLPFELASYLLLVAAVAAVMLARRRRGLPELEPGGPARLQPEPVPTGVGTMAETTGVRPGGRVQPATGATGEEERPVAGRGGW